MEAPPITTTLVDGVRVVVPDSLELITPYVLQEQHDWFEDEIRFVRLLLEPGDHAIDVGANYGVYALSMARAVGPAGHVWAFEPASHPAAFLELSISANGYTNVTLERAALSSTAGTAQLSINSNSELGALHRDTSAEIASESVRVTTLDECLSIHRWDRIGFVKIDAEGEEANIVAGGARFLEALSPLVQYEVRVADSWQLDLVDLFAARGYASYRLIPALNVLMPFEAASDPTGLLNLFACKPKRAQSLAARDLLVPTHATAAERAKSLEAARERTAKSRSAGGPAPSVLARAMKFVRRSGKASPVTALHDGLALYALSLDTALPARLRLCALESSVHELMRAYRARPTAARLASLARAALDFGAWRIGVDALLTLCRMLSTTPDANADEPFVAPAARFDTLEVRGSFRDWLFAGTLDALDAQSVSSYYDAAAATQRLRLIEQLGYADADVERRLALLEKRAAASGVEPAPAAAPETVRSACEDTMTTKPILLRRDAVEGFEEHGKQRYRIDGRNVYVYVDADVLAKARS